MCFVAPVRCAGSAAGTFSSGLSSAFAALAGTLPMDLEPLSLSMLDMSGILRAGSRGLPSLSNAGSLEQLLPSLEPYGASLNEFLLGEAC
jgi:hypothetical protein